MTIKILLQEVTSLWSPEFDTPVAFAEQVRQYVAAMEEYNAHLEGVRADAENVALKPEERRVAFPPPDHHPLVKRAAAEGYEIVGPSLDEKKAALFAEVRRMEGDAVSAVDLPAKRRHWQFREQDIIAADHMRVSNHPTPIDASAVASWLRSVRPGEDNAFLDDMTVRREKVTAVHRWAAKLEHDIDDLTDEAVDGFVIEAFK